MTTNVEPPKPKHVPSQAIWNAAKQTWEVGERNVAGKCVGNWQWWQAPKGYLVCEALFNDTGKAVELKRYHPNGELAQAISFDEKGKSTHAVYMKSTEPSPERFEAESCQRCPENAWKAIRKTNAYPISFDLFDRDGDRINSDGIKFSEIPRIKAQAQQKAKEEAIAKLMVLREKKVKWPDRDQDQKNNVKNISSQEAEELYQIHNYIRYDLREEDQIVLYTGNVFLDHLELDQIDSTVAGVIVDGNLIVKENITNFNHDFGPFLFVTQNLYCKNLVVGGSEVWVKQNAYAQRAIWTYGNHGILHIAKDAFATMLVCDDHHTIVECEIHAIVISSGQLKSNITLRCFCDLFVPDILSSDDVDDYDEYLLYEEVFDHIKDDRPLLLIE